MKSPSTTPSGPDSLRISPLGGLGEVGMNMMVLECGGDAIVVDCGQRMPEEDTPGIDLIVPDPTHLENVRDRLRGIVLTHGHEDHIGALPHLWPRLRVPIWGRRLTLALVREKLKEYHLLREAELNTVETRHPFELGAFKITFVHVTHSISEASALIIETPVGTVVHSGDYRMDETPTDGEAFDRESLREAGDRGVLVLLGDSTNVGRAGRTMSEADLLPHFERLVGEADGAVVVGCFSSSTHRVRLLCEIAQRTERQVFVVGLSMNRTVRICRELGLLDVPDDLFTDPAQYRDAPRDRCLVIATGTQGEPQSALSKIALGEHRHIDMEEGDRVILSARIIPGNERAIYRMINHMCRRGVEIVTSMDATVHTSGHAQRDEMREMIELTRPRHLIPIHGEYRHLIEHRRLGIEMGIPEERIFVIENGNVIEFNGNGGRRAGDIPAGRIFVDGLGVGDISEVVLRDRKHLASDGMMVVILAVDRQSRELTSTPDLVSRGFVHCDEGEDGIEECKRVVRRAFEAMPRESREESVLIEEETRRALRRFIKKNYQRRPMILPVVMEI